MRKSFYWIASAVFACSAMVMTSCSSDDQADETVALVSQDVSSYNDLWQRLKEELNKSDLQELAVLLDALQESTPIVGNAEVPAQTSEELSASLQQLLEQLLGQNETPEANANTWQFDDLLKALEAAIHLDEIVEQLSGMTFKGENLYGQSYDIVVNDTLAYKISLTKKRNGDTQRPSYLGNTERQLTISKNGVALLTIDTNQDNSIGYEDDKLFVNTITAGSLVYKDKKFTLDRKATGTASVISEIAFYNGDSNVVKILSEGTNNLTLENLLHGDVVYKGKMDVSAIDNLLDLKLDVSDLGAFYANGLALAVFGVTGTTKEQCQKYTDGINKVLAGQFYVGGNETGKVFIVPELADSVRNTYVPAVMLESPEGEKISLQLLIDTFGPLFWGSSSRLM